jgi:type I restriction enzyme S subunit
MPRSDWSIVAKYALQAPGPDEQQAIAKVLSDMDSEIEALVAERDKMRLVKQGMMQELLSGRVRLV